MKIKLLIDIPVSPSYGMTAGTVVEAERTGKGRHLGGPRWTAVSPVCGELIGVMSHEAVEVMG